MLKKNNKIEFHYIISVFYLLLFLVIGSCANTQTDGNDIQTKIDIESMEAGKNTLDESSSSIRSSLFGLVMANGNDIYIIQNWRSRSKVSFKVNGKFKVEISKQNGNLIAVKGLIEKIQKWSGKIDVLGIERVWEDGKTIDVEGMIVIKKGQPFIREAHS